MSHTGYNNYYKQGGEPVWQRATYDGSYIPQAYHPPSLTHPQAIFPQVLPPQAHLQAHQIHHPQVHPQLHPQLHSQLHPPIHPQLHPQSHVSIQPSAQQQLSQQQSQQPQSSTSSSTSSSPPPAATSNQSQQGQPPTQQSSSQQTQSQPSQQPQSSQSQENSQSQSSSSSSSQSQQSQSQSSSQQQSSSQSSSAQKLPQNPNMDPNENEEEQEEPDDENEEIAVKLLVPNNMVGSIIGKGGITIKDITAQTTAKIHIAQGDDMSPERMVTITGSATNAGQAQFQICVKMQEEAYAEINVESDLPLEQRMALLPLKLLVPNGVVGRLIGKGGVNLKKTMAETNTYITCSKEDEFTRFTGDRIVSVIGSVEDQYKAQMAVTHQVRQYTNSQAQANAISAAPPGTEKTGSSPVSYEAAPAPQGQRNPQRTENYNYQYNSRQNHSPSYAQTSRLPFAIAPELQEHEETICVQVPNGVVGSIIGKGGATVRDMGSRSRCQIRVARNDEVDANAANRPITLTGTIDALFKAQTMIFNKIAEAPPAVGGGPDHQLRVELTVPNEMVGRVIGKKGAQVRKIIDVSGARVTINQEEDDDSNGTVVSIVGPLNSNFLAQYRIHEILFFQNSSESH